MQQHLNILAKHSRKWLYTCCMTLAFGTLSSAALAGGKGGETDTPSDLDIVLLGQNQKLECLNVDNLQANRWLKFKYRQADGQTAQKNVYIKKGHNLLDLTNGAAQDGQIRFFRQPSDLVLKLNGKEIDPANGFITLPVGQYELSATRSGFHPMGQQVSVTPCTPASVAVRLNKINEPQSITFIPSEPETPAEPMTPSEPETPAVQTLPTYSIGTPFNDCEDCPTMVVIPQGQNIMGTQGGGIAGDAPIREVQISKKFAVSETEITFAQWDACVADQGCRHKADNDYGWGRGSRPVVNVSWNDAQDYVTWLSMKTNSSYRLLTEAEWEFAARAGTQSPYWWGNTIDKNKANCADCGNESAGKKTTPVKSFGKNSFGLYDTSGNVWEWTQDCYNEKAYTTFKSYPDAVPGENQCNRVLRGGAWDLIAAGAVASFRFNAAPNLRTNNIGLRVARDLKN